jgi:hypothetical protein
MSFAISLILWLNGKAGPRISMSFKRAAGPDGTLDFKAFKTGLQELISWNESTMVSDAVISFY